MKGINIYLGVILVCCLVGIPAYSQPLAQNNIPIERISRLQCSGTAMPYAYQPRKQSAPPAGYSPFYINHVGRHGARYLSSASKITQVLKILHSAKQQNRLTARGAEIDSFLTELSVLSEDRWGELTALGKEEQRNIARRMITNYPAVFDPVRGDSMTIFSISTNVHRCIESMESFIAELKSLNPTLIIHSESGTKFDSILRFFDCNPAYNAYKERGGWENVRYFSDTGRPTVLGKQQPQAIPAQRALNHRTRVTGRYCRTAVRRFPDYGPTGHRDRRDMCRYPIRPCRNADSLCCSVGYSTGLGPDRQSSASGCFVARLRHRSHGGKYPMDILPQRFKRNYCKGTA